MRVAKISWQERCAAANHQKQKVLTSVCAKLFSGLASRRSQPHMRYPKGSVHLGSFKDEVILDFLAESRHATRSQLMQFVRYYYCEFNWPVFNWRVRRMVDTGLVRKQAPPMLNGCALLNYLRRLPCAGGSWDLPSGCHVGSRATSS